MAKKKEDETVKRVGLYFNLEDAEEKEMYDYINARKKSRYIKTLIMNDIRANKYNMITIQQPIANEKDDLNDCDLESDVLDFD